MSTYPPPGRLKRKWRKFRQDPVRFFADARSPVVRNAGLWALAGRPKRKKSMLGRAIDYYRHNGLKRSLRVLRKKLLLRKSGVPLAQKIGHQPTAEVTDQYLAGHLGWLEKNNIGKIYKQPEEIFSRPFVAIIGDLNLPQCKKYRVLQKNETLLNAGINTGYSHYLDSPRSLDLMQLATAVILYRMPSCEQFTRYCMEAVRLGIPVGYDIDDPIFVRDVYRKNPNLQFLEPWEKESLLSGCERYFSALRACDFVIASTPGMQSLIEDQYSGPVYLWRNALDSETLHNATVATAQRQISDSDSEQDITLTYASGSRAHEADFRTMENALVEIMTRHPAVKFSIIGHLNLPERLEPFTDRITAAPFADYASYMNHIATSSILLVPLVDDPFNECKSAIRYLEGAALGIPTVATATGDFKNIVTDGKNGFLASSTEGWINALDRLIASPSLRRKIGSAAKRHVLKTQSTNAVMGALHGGLLRKLSAEFAK